MMEKLSIHQFNLGKLKCLNDTVEVEYQIEKVDGNEVYHEKLKRKSTIIPHPDLTNQIKFLKPMAGTVLGFNKETTERITCTGISVRGIGDNERVIITCTYKTPNNKVIALNTPDIPVGLDTNTTYGFEQDLKAIKGKLSEECFSFLYENKKAQLDIAFDDNIDDNYDLPDPTEIPDGKFDNENQDKSKQTEKNEKPKKEKKEKVK